VEFLSSLENSAFADWIRLSPSLWAYPGILTFHTIGLAMLVGANAVVDLRLLNFGRGLPLSKLEGFFPAMWLGFAINAVSGVLLFLADATNKATQPIFYVKLALIAVALVIAGVMRRTIRESDSGVPSQRARLLATLSLVLWAAAITAGRFMAYLNNEPPPVI
jgi:hypothetical protein